MKRLVLLVSLYIFSTGLKAQVIPADRRVDWTYAGLQRSTPTYANVVNINSFGGIGNGIVPNDAALQAAITSLGTDSGVIYFPAGNYLFVTKVTLRSGLILRGEDATSTTLTFNLGGIDDLISATGTATGTITTISAAVVKGQDYVLVANPTLFTAGDYVKLTFNDSALVFDTYKIVGQILRIKSIAADTVTFYSPLRRGYLLEGAPQLRKLDVVSGVGIECLKIKRMDATASQKTNILFKYAAQCWVTGVESDSANFSHISLDNSTNIAIRGCYFHGSFAYGSGGSGYGVSAHNTAGECLIENSVFRHLRHSMIAQLGANGNVFSHNYSREPFKSESFPNDLAGDIVLHGNYPYANLFESNVVQNIIIDASHGLNGPYNTFFRNRAQLYGIVMSNASADSSNFVGNEVTGTGFGQGNYTLKGTGNFEYGNNVKGTIVPAGTTNLTENSYYYSSEPYFWLLSSAWPPIGIPNTFNTRTIPAEMRYNAGSTLTECSTGILPNCSIRLTSETRDGKHMLQWRVSSCDEVRVFEVEQSVDGRSFSSIAKVAPSALQKTFRLAVKTSRSSTYYRIRIISLTRGSKLSNVVSISDQRDISVNVYPNPATTQINIAAGEAVTVGIKNVAGQVVYSAKESAANRVIDIGKWSKGVYFIQVTEPVSGKRVTRKFVKE